MVAGAAKYFTGEAAATVLGLLQSIMVTRALGPATYGVFGAVMALTATMRGFFGVSFAAGLTRELVAARVNRDSDRIGLAIASALVSDLACNTIAFIAIMFVAPTAAAKIAGGVQVVHLYRLYAITCLTVVPRNAWFAVTRDRGKFGQIGAITAVAAALRVLTVAVCFRFELLNLPLAIGITILFEAVMATAWLTFLAIGVREAYDLSLLRLPYQHTLRRWRELLEMWKLTGHQYIGTFFSSTWKNCDLLVIGLFWSDAAVGHYALAKRLVAVVQQASSVLAAVIYQDFNELLAARHGEQLLRQLRKVLRLSLSIGAVELLLLWLVAPPMVVLAFGREYAPTIPLFRWLTIGTVGLTVMFWSNSLLLALNGYRESLRSIIAATMIGVVTAYSASRWLGPWAVAATQSATWIGLYLAQTWLALRLLRCDNAAQQ